MAYDFLGLVNDVNSRLNEVTLDSTNFATATGYYNVAKDSVNAAIRHINQEEFEWPWNHVQSDLYYCRFYEIFLPFRCKEQ